MGVRRGANWPSFLPVGNCQAGSSDESIERNDSHHIPFEVFNGATVRPWADCSLVCRSTAAMGAMQPQGDPMTRWEHTPGSVVEANDLVQ